MSEETARARVGPLGVLAHDPEIDAVSRQHEGSEIDVQVQFEAHLQQQPALDQPGWDLGGPHGTEIERVEATPFVEDLVGQHRAVTPVARATEVVLDGVEDDASRRDDLQTLSDDLGADAVSGKSRELKGLQAK